MRSFWLFAVFLNTGCAFASAKTDFSNYNAYNYDMATPQFTPDGKLLQVEYASAATDLSSPLVALQTRNNTLVLIALKKSNTQNRIALLQDNICVAMSGVLADSLALLQFVLKEASKNFLRCKKELSILEIATTMANACQLNSFGGGIRPYGTTMLVCGSPKGKENIILYQTDPSGAIIEAPPPDSQNQVRWLIGGGQTLQRQLRKRIDQALDRQRNSEPPTIGETVALAARILIKEYQKQSKGGKMASSSSDTPMALEVVILSPSLGCHRLTEDQLNFIMDKR